MNAHVALLQPAGMPAGIDPRDWRKAIETRLNELLDQSFALITALDCMEADCDLEETGDLENWLGWPIGQGRSFGPDNTDREQDNSDDEDGHDAELDQTDGETVQWSERLDIPQEGPNWHYNGIG